MRRILAILLCIPLLLTGCFGGSADPEEKTVLGSLLDKVQDAESDGSEEKNVLGGILDKIQDGENDTPEDKNILDGLLDKIQNGGSQPYAEGPAETVPGVPEHIAEWTDPLEDIPEPTYYAVDEELSWAMSLIGMAPIPPEDTLDTEASVIPTDGLWSTERTYSYSDSLTSENLQDFFAMYAGDADLTVHPPVMETTPKTLGGAAEDPALKMKSIQQYYNEQSVMISVFENFVEKHLDAYNEDKGLDDSVYLYLTALYSWDMSMELAMGASFNEEDDWEMMQSGIVMAVEMFGGKDVTVTRNAAHNYSITYTNGDGAKITDHFRADSGNGIQMLTYKDDALYVFFEFIELGDDMYVWQSSGERLLMEYKDKTVLSCWYSKLDESVRKNTENELIYGTDTVTDAAWVMEKEDFYTRISFDGALLDITTVNFFIGGIGKAKIDTVNP